MQKRRAHNKKGFTLIEVLIVITIVAIAMSFVMPNFFGATERQNIQGFSEQLQNKIELARDKAVQQNQEWGLRIDRGEVSFLVFDYASQQWSQMTENPFNSIYYGNFAEIYLKVEEHGHGFDNQGDNLPDLVFFSSGEASPFKIEIRALSSDGEPWVLFSNGLSNTQIRYSVL